MTRGAGARGNREARRGAGERKGEAARCARVGGPGAVRRRVFEGPGGVRRPMTRVRLSCF